jgi:hypothetical protein
MKPVNEARRHGHRPSATVAVHSTDSGADAERAGENELRQVNAYPWECKRP